MTATYAFIFGRNPELSRLELLAVASRFHLRVGKQLLPDVCLVQSDAELTPTEVVRIQNYLGGTLRIVQILAETQDRLGVVAATAGVVSAEMPEVGKLLVGVSTWSGSGRPYPAFKIAKDLKALLTKAGRSVRMVTPREPRFQLDTPQIFHNKLVEKGVDLACFWVNGGWMVGVTRSIQDISDYTKRDFGIPKPDAVSGMLPPKLAQSMINLAVGSREDVAVYDPFCGNGRMLLEGALLNLQVYGSDISEKQVEASLENLEWLRKTYNQATRDEKIWQADATEGPRRLLGEKFVIVTEPYLGKPLRSPLKPEQKEEWLRELANLYIAFFKYWSKAPEKPTNMLVVFPKAMVAGGGNASLFSNLVDRLREIGYSAEVLFSYSRPDSIVHRDLVQISFR